MGARMTAVTTLFVDLGGVLVTGLWDRVARHRAVEQFDLDAEDFSRRHELTCPLYEEGKIGLDDCLDLVVFHAKQPFTKGEFRQFMFTQPQPAQEMIELIRAIKGRYGLRVLLVGNGGRELVRHAIGDLELREWVDFFVCSCFVGRRKPDPELYEMAMDMCQVRCEEVLCIEEHVLCVRVVKKQGLRAVQHVCFQFTRDALASWGLAVEPQPSAGDTGD